MKNVVIISSFSLLIQIISAQSELLRENAPFLNYSNRQFETRTIMDSSALDSFINAKMFEYNVPGLVASLIKMGNPTQTYSYGYANIEQNIEVTDSTIFYLASISKTVTATALMQLWEDGLFELDSNINNYLPPELQIINSAWPNESITFRQLLTHTSSADYDWDFINTLTAWGDDSPISLDTFVANYFVPGGDYYVQGPFNIWAPGDQWEYSNEAFALIGYLVEALSDTTFADYCQENIFTPLQMDDTSWFLSDLDTNNMAISYPEGPIQHHHNPIYPCGWLRTSVSHLTNFISTYIHNGDFNGTRLLDSSTIDLMTTVQYPPINTFQGLAWRNAEYYDPQLGIKSYSYHHGNTSTYGCLTTAGFTHGRGGDQIGIIILLNSNPSSRILEEIWDELYFYGWTYDEICPSGVNVSKTYIEQDVDSLSVNARFQNPNDHIFTANAIIQNTDSTIVDTFALYDDGFHDDGLVGDGLWGAIISPQTVITNYDIHISTDDQVSGEDFILTNMSRFTTIGPIVFDDITFITDTIAEPGDYISFQFALANLGSTGIAESITTTLSSDDSCFSTLSLTGSFGDIGPGESNVIVGGGGFRITDSCPGNVDLTVTVNIYSNEYHFWTDSFNIHVYEPQVTIADIGWLPQEYSLSQNHPNPFNPITSIQYQLPERSDVTITIHDLLGRKVTALVSEKQEPGYKSVQWDATNVPSGMYFYQIRAGEFVQTRKMVVLK